MILVGNSFNHVGDIRSTKGHNSFFTLWFVNTTNLLGPTKGFFNICFQSPTRDQKESQKWEERRQIMHEKTIDRTTE